MSDSGDLEEEQKKESLIANSASSNYIGTDKSNNSDEVDSVVNDKKRKSSAILVDEDDESATRHKSQFQGNLKVEADGNEDDDNADLPSKSNKKMKSSKDSSDRVNVSKYFDNEAQESDEDEDPKKSKSKKTKDDNMESDDESEDEEDDNNYKIDGFVVGENTFDSDADSDSGMLNTKKTEKRQLSRLKKRKDDFMLDEDDYLLIEDNRKSSTSVSKKNQLEDDDDDNVIAPMRITNKPNKIPKSGGDDDDDDIQGGGYDDDDLVPDDDDDEDDEGNFIVDDAREGESPNQSIKDRSHQIERDISSSRRAAKAASYLTNDGPSIDQIQDAREIFGDAFEFDDLDEEDDIELDEYDDEDEDDDIPKKKLTKEELILTNLRKRLDRSQLVANFCTTRDDDIRAIDRPERFQSMLVGRSTPNEEERAQESLWVSDLLAKKINEKGGNYVSSSELRDSVSIILKYFQVDNLEVPFIYTYRRDYLHPILDKTHLWFILSCDEKWEQLYIAKSNVIKTISHLKEAASRSEVDSFVETKRHNNLMRNILDEIESISADIKSARASEEDARDIVNGNMDEPDDIKEEDNSRLQRAIEHHRELVNQLKQKQLELSHARIEGDELKRKSEHTLKYHPNVAKEVLRLFPEERYVPMLELAVDETHVKDISQYLDLLIRGAKGIHKGITESKASQESVSKTSKGATLNKDKYSKLLHFSPQLRNLVEQVSLPVYEIGDAVRHNIPITQPAYPTTRIDVNAMVYITASEVSDELFGGSNVVSLLQNEKQVMAAVEWIIASELFHEPSIRRESRALYRQYASLTTRPTKKGLLSISPFSELFGIHFLEKKPVSDLYSNQQDKTLFIRLWEAQSNDLITVQLNSESQSNDAVEFYITKLGLRKAFQPGEEYSMQDIDPLVKDSWDSFREKILRTLVQKLMLPFLEQELKRDLMRVGRETIIDEAADKFTDTMLSIGPFRPVSDPKVDLTNLLMSCPRLPYYGSVMSVFISAKDPLYLSFIDRNGTLRGHDLLPVRAMNERRQKLKDFMMQYKPETIVINASGGQASKGTYALIEKELVREVRQAIEDKNAQKKVERRNRSMEYDDESVENDDEDDGEIEPYHANVGIINDDVALIYQHSPRAKKQFPELQPGAAAAVCLGRFAQEPLAEYCNMFWSADATEVFGHELLFLDLHRHKSLLRGIRLPLIRELERRLVDAVNEVGVDINLAVSYDHLAGMLGFISGLGLRKADALRSSIRKSYNFIQSRKDLLVNNLLGPIVYNNAVGFIRIRSENYDQEGVDENGESLGDKKSYFDRDEDGSHSRKLNPLDNTRIHPECYITYDFVQKLCGDALDKEFQPLDYYDIIYEARQASKTKLTTMTKTKWLDLWKNYTRPTQATYEDEFINKQTQEIVKKTYPSELRDKLQLLDLDEYLEDLERAGKGKRRLQCEMIKEELRYPWLDLRIPLPSMPSQTEMFKIITNETDYSLHIGLQIGCVVTEIIDQSMTNTSSRGSAYKRIQKAIVKTDIGLKGTISSYEILDDKQWNNETYNIRDYLFVGKRIVSVVIGIHKDKMNLDLSIKPSYLARTESGWIKNRFFEPALAWFQQSSLLLKNQNRYAKPAIPGQNNNDSVGFSSDVVLYDQYFLESEALNAFDKAESLAGDGKAVSLDTVIQSERENSRPSNSSSSTSEKQTPGSKAKRSRMRNIYHPLFANLDFREAEERLRKEGKGAGEVIFRPSSKGFEHLTITWAFVDGMYKHIDIEERGKTNMNDIGRELYIREGDGPLSEPYADLDEIYSRYIEPMNDFVSIMMRSKFFLKGSPEDVEQQMRRDIDNNPVRIPYFIRLEPGKPGFFALTWMSLNAQSSQPVKKELIAVRPNGYRMKSQTFSQPTEVINYFKKVTTAAINAAQAAALPPLPKTRKSRFADAAPPGAPPPPPIGHQPPIPSALPGSYPPPVPPYRQGYDQAYYPPPPVPPGSISRPY